jgi:heptosyltransferase-2
MNTSGPVVVTSLTKIGDFVVTTPLIRALAKAFPERDLVLAVSAAVADLAVTCPYAASVVQVRTRVGTTHVLYNMAAAQRAAAEVRRLSPSIVVVPRWSDDLYFEAPLARLSGAATRVGFVETATPQRARRNRGYNALFTATHPGVSGIQESAQQLLLLELLGAPSAGDEPELWLTDEDRAVARAMLSPLESKAGYIALAPGAGTLHRRWPPERFGAVAAQLAAEGWHPVVLGGTEDRGAGAAIRAAEPTALDLCGQLTLRQTAAALATCRLVLTNDSAPAHLAAAVGTPIVELSPHPRGAPPDHDNAPERYAPRGSPVIVLRPNGAPSCRRGCEAQSPHCILEIDVADVLKAAHRMLTSYPGAHDPVSSIQ